MQKYAEAFYLGTAWRACRADYLKKAHGLCENCLAKGIYTPATMVHHIEHITPSNIDNPEITLSFNNLKALCRNCHAEAHAKAGGKRYRIDGFGRVISFD